MLFSRPTYAALLAVLDNYNWMTGQAENFSSQQLAEQDVFLKETMSNTALGRELFAFLHSKGNYCMQLKHKARVCCSYFNHFSFDESIMCLKVFINQRKSFCTT